MGVKKLLFSSLLLLRGPATPPPPLVVPWVIKILGPYFNVAVDAIGPKTDFTLETNRKKVKEKLLKTIQNREFYLLNLEFQTIKIQYF